MLNLINPEDAEGQPILEIVKEYRKSQVSRFPVDVRFTNCEARFFDTRFPGKAIATVFSETNHKNEEYWVIESRLIQNERFRNNRAHQKQTKDTKKLLRFMRDYIRTVSIKEIASVSAPTFQGHVSSWKDQAMSKVRDHCTIHRDELMDEIMRMKAVGYAPQTKRFMEIMEIGVPHWEEKARRFTRKVMQVYVFINPDETVELYCPDTLGYAGIQHGNNFYNALVEAPECIQQQVAMLRMMEIKTFVAEVGVRVSDNSFWIEVMGE